jgi:hypothetical protein
MTDPPTPAAAPPDDARQRPDQKPERERAPGIRDDVKPGQATYNPMSEALGRIS